MAIHYNEGEKKVRPGIFQRYTNRGFNALAGASDGICAIPVQANWGPLGLVVGQTQRGALTKNYGTGTYGSGYTIPAAEAMFDGGATTVYTYRLGTGGKAATVQLAEGLMATAKYVGTMKISVAVQEKLGDTAKKQLLVYVNGALMETWDFAADSTAERANLIKAAANSKYLTISGAAATIPVLAVASGALTGGENPTVTNEDYSKAFAAFEPYYYNAIALDVDDDEDMTLSLLLQAYLEGASYYGKIAIAVVGEKTSVDFELRAAHAAAFDSEMCVYLGGGWMSGSESKDGVLAICQTAGTIAATPSNKSITHAVITGATALCETRTYAEYEAAIGAGMLMVSLSQDGSVWYDSGINTLINLEEGIQDEGWKKIRRMKTRIELFHRLDLELEPKVGRVSQDTDGIADIIQAGQRIVDAMVKEGKLFAGASFVQDPDNPAEADSAWFIIVSDDIDSLEKIYLHYQFRYSQNA